MSTVPESRVPLRPGGRPIGRWLAAVGLLALGAFAAPRVPVSVLPDATFPELSVELALPRGSDLDENARRWLVPIEAALRSAGGVGSMAGWAWESGASWTVRLDPDVDPDRKTARIEASLGSLRRRLPEGASISVDLGRGRRDFSAAVAVPAGAADALRDEMALLDGVERVLVAGRGSPEHRIRLGAGTDSEAVEAAIRHGEGRVLGRLGSGRAAARVVASTAPRAGPLGDLPVLDPNGRWVPLSERATDEGRRSEPVFRARDGGRSAVVLLIARDPGFSPLLFDRQVRRVLTRELAEDEVRFVLDEASRIRGPLVRSAVGVLVASLLGSLVAGVVWRGARLRAAATWFVLPWTGLAVATVVFLASSGTLDLTTLPGVLVGLATGSAVASVGLRRPVSILEAGTAAALPLLATELAAGAAAPLLRPVLSAWAVPFVATVAAAWVLPMPALPARGPAGWFRALSGALRGRATALLAATTGSYVLFLLLGPSLQPSSARLSARLSDLVVDATLPSTTGSSGVAAVVDRIEARLDATEDVVGHWSLSGDDWVSVFVDVREDLRVPARLDLVARRLEASMVTAGAAIRVVARGGAGGQEPLELRPELGQKPETDRESTYLTYLVQARDMTRLVLAFERTVDAAVDRRVRVPGQPDLPPMAAVDRSSLARRDVRADWIPPESRIELVPRPSADPAVVRALEDTLARRAGSGSETPLPGRATRRLVAADAREDPLEPAARSEVLRLRGPGDRVPVDAVFRIGETPSPPRVRREEGRFVLPVRVAVRGPNRTIREARRGWLASRIARAELPDGVGVELPELDERAWTRERLRLTVLASVLPLLLFAWLAVRTASLTLAARALLVLTPAVAIVLPFLRQLSESGRMDERGLLALVAVLSAAIVPAGRVATALRPVPVPAGLERPEVGGVRELSRQGTALVPGLAFSGAVLVLPGLGLDPRLEVWLPGLWTAWIAGAAAVLALAFVLPGFLWPWRLRGSTREELDESPPVLEVRKVTKVYPGGVRALRRVGFRLEPGITGLLGPNGAGKTTLLRLLCGILDPSRGRILFEGRTLDAAALEAYRRRVGYLPQRFDAYPGLSVERFLGYWTRRVGIPRSRREAEIAKVLEIVDLVDATDRKVVDLSGGMRRRIGIARALLGDPPIVVVDEPTTGLDVPSRRRLREALLSVAEDRVVVFSTHISSDVATVASRVLVLDAGRLRWDGDVDGLVTWARGRVFEATLADAELTEFGHRHHVTTRVRTLDGVRVRAVDGGAGVEGEVVAPTLEEAYLALMLSREGGRRGGRTDARTLLDLEAWRTTGRGPRFWRRAG